MKNYCGLLIQSICTKANEILDSGFLCIANPRFFDIGSCVDVGNGKGVFDSIFTVFPVA